MFSLYYLKSNLGDHYKWFLKKEKFFVILNKLYIISKDFTINKKLKMQELNEQILIFLNSLMQNKIIETMVKLFADSPILFIPIFLLLSWLYYTFKNKDENKKKELLIIFYSSIIAIIINLSIQQIVHFDRPETVLEWTWKLLLNHIPDASFPSDHAAVSLSFLTALFLANYKKTAYIFLIPVILMNISRVIVWVHWPFDIVAGCVVWIWSAFISFKLLKKSHIINRFNNCVLKIMNFIKM